MSDIPAAPDGAFDYHGWVQRALRFMDRVARLEGVEVRAREVEAPDAAAASRRGPIVPVLAEFLRTGAGSLYCSYVYEPSGRAREELMTIFPGMTAVYGGARMSSPREIADSVRSVREWARDVIVDDPAERAIWEHAQPFIFTENGDYLALDMRTGAADPRVVYLDHEDEAFPLALSFTAFLAAWERLCYIGPEHWLLGEFRGANGFLDPDFPRAAALRALFGQDAPPPAA
jgi:hypothetical protein